MRSLILSCILTLFATNVFADDMVLGQYACMVKSTQLVTIEDGITNKYSGYENGISVGEILIFRIKKSRSPETKDLEFYLHNLEGDKIYDFGFLENPRFDDEMQMIVE